jgi:hypothetical protein
VVSTRVLSPYQAVLWAAFFNFAWYRAGEQAAAVGMLARPLEAEG